MVGKPGGPGNDLVRSPGGRRSSRLCAPKNCPTTGREEDMVNTGTIKGISVSLADRLNVVRHRVVSTSPISDDPLLGGRHHVTVTRRSYPLPRLVSPLAIPSGTVTLAISPAIERLGQRKFGAESLPRKFSFTGKATIFGAPAPAKFTLAIDGPQQSTEEFEALTGESSIELGFNTPGKYTATLTAASGPLVLGSATGNFELRIQPGIWDWGWLANGKPSDTLRVDDYIGIFAVLAFPGAGPALIPSSVRWCIKEEGQGCSWLDWDTETYEIEGEQDTVYDWTLEPDAKLDAILASFFARGEMSISLRQGAISYVARPDAIVNVLAE